MKKVFDGFVLIMVALVTTAVGDVIVFGDSIGIAQTKGEIGDKISVDTVGVYEFTATTADAISVGDVLYWDASNKEVTTNSNSNANIRAGVSWSDKAGAVAGTVYVKIG